MPSKKRLLAAIPAAALLAAALTVPQATQAASSADGSVARYEPGPADHYINYAPPLQRSPAATEAMFLMMRRVFDELGYRRYEWKCDALNAPSRGAAERLGFTYEGIFRQATIYKGRNRDTAWYSITDAEWPRIKAAYESWLDPANFDAQGKQRQRLSDLTKRSGGR